MVSGKRIMATSLVAGGGASQAACHVLVTVPANYSPQDVMVFSEPGAAFPYLYECFLDRRNGFLAFF